MLKNRACTIVAAAAMVTGVYAPVRAADDGAQVAENIRKAVAAVASFQATMTGPPGMTAQVTFVRPDRVRNVISVGSSTAEAIAVGTTTYVRSNGGPWGRSSNAGTAAAARQLVDSLVSSTSYTALPERRENGATVGAFSAALPASFLPVPLKVATASSSDKTAPPLTVTCTYDKATYLVHTCTMQLPNFPGPLTMTYSKWNDPANVVDVPAGQPAAPAAPASASSASPSPSPK